MASAARSRRPLSTDEALVEVSARATQPDPKALIPMAKPMTTAPTTAAARRSRRTTATSAAAGHAAAMPTRGARQDVADSPQLHTARPSTHGQGLASRRMPRAAAPQATVNQQARWYGWSK